MSEDSRMAFRIDRWSLFVLTLPLSAFISYLGWVGTGFGAMPYVLFWLLVLPVQAIAFYSFRIASAGMWALLAAHLIFSLRGASSVHWSDLAPSGIDYSFWTVVILMTVAAVLPVGDAERPHLQSE